MNVFEFTDVLETFNGENEERIINQLHLNDIIKEIEETGGSLILSRYGYWTPHTNLLKYICIKYFCRCKLVDIFIPWRAIKKCIISEYLFMMLKLRIKNKITFKQFQKRVNEYLNNIELKNPDLWIIRDDVDMLYVYTYAHGTNIMYYDILVKELEDNYSARLNVYKIQ